MNTIGKILKKERRTKKISYGDLSKETKIKVEFIKAVENERWGELSDYPVVAGYVKSIANAIRLDEKKAIATLRRDYPPQSASITPKPDVERKFRWSPKLTFAIGIFFSLVAIVSYLAYQYNNFVTPPLLEINRPQEEEVIRESFVVVSGKTDPSAIIKVNNQPTLVEENGLFSTEIEIFEGTGEIVIKSISRNGKETVVVKKIKPELGN